MNKLNLRAFLLVIAVISVISGCTGTTVTTKQPETAEKPVSSEVELVPARKSEDSSSKTVVVERDGKYYEMLKEHERLCSDCDK